MLKDSLEITKHNQAQKASCGTRSTATPCYTFFLLFLYPFSNGILLMGTILGESPFTTVQNILLICFGIFNFILECRSICNRYN